MQERSAASGIDIVTKPRAAAVATQVVAALAMLAIFPEVASADTSYRVRSEVSGGIQNMRSGPGVGHDIVVAIPAGSDGIKKLGQCRGPDDNTSRFTWCRFSWKGKTGWISVNGLEEVASSGGEAGFVRTINALDLARAGIAWMFYDGVAGLARDYVKCPYQGEGHTISLSRDVVAQYKQRGFSLRATCLALASEKVRFDPSNGGSLQRYQLPGYGNDPEYQFPFFVSDCFKEVKILADRNFEVEWRPVGCVAKYDPATGNPVSNGAAIKLVTGGAAGDAPDESAVSSSGTTSSAKLGTLISGR